MCLCTLIYDVLYSAYNILLHMCQFIEGNIILKTALQLMTWSPIVIIFFLIINLCYGYFNNVIYFIKIMLNLKRQLSELLKVITNAEVSPWHPLLCNTRLCSCVNVSYDRNFPVHLNTSNRVTSAHAGELTW